MKIAEDTLLNMAARGYTVKDGKVVYVGCDEAERFLDAAIAETRAGSGGGIGAGIVTAGYDFQPGA